MAGNFSAIALCYYSVNIGLMDTASREVISHKARLAGNGCSLAKRRNTVDDHFPARPKGVSQSVQYGVAALDKGTTIACGPRLALNALGSSVSINPMLAEY